MALYPRPGSSHSPAANEFEILKASHKFLRDDEDHPSSWDDQLAAKYYSSLFREFAVCDLKHYKSGNFSLRWRTESEVLSGAGETSCANTRCEHHPPPPEGEQDIPSATHSVPLTVLELPFAYEEHGEMKSALVKVVLCSRCCKKLMWKRSKDKEDQLAEGSVSASSKDNVNLVEKEARHARSSASSRRKSREDSSTRHAEEHGRRRRDSRSRSPRRTDSNRYHALRERTPR